MKNQYVVEITEKQVLFISVEAETPQQAIDIALEQHEELTWSPTSEVEKITARIVRMDDGED